MLELPPPPPPPPSPAIGRNPDREVRSKLLQLRFFPGEYQLFLDALGKYRKNNGRISMAEFVHRMVWDKLYEIGKDKDGKDIIVNYLELERLELKALRLEPKKPGEGNNPTKTQIVMKVSQLDLAQINWKKTQAGNIKSQNHLVMTILLPACLLLLMQPDDEETVRRQRIARLNSELEEARKQRAEKQKLLLELAEDEGDTPGPKISEIAAEIEGLKQKIRDLIDHGATAGTLHTQTKSFLQEAAGEQASFIDQPPLETVRKKRGRPAGSKNRPKS